MGIPPADMLAVALRAARGAASLCLAVLDEAPATPQAMAKLGREPVTVADYGSQAVILEALASSFPTHGVLAEEGAAHFRQHASAFQMEQTVRLVGQALDRRLEPARVLEFIDHRGGADGHTWVVDPIDGTKGFLRREQFAVAVGLLHRGRPLLGVLACPHLALAALGGVRGAVFWATRGQGAFADTLTGGQALPIRVSEVRHPAAVRVLGSVESEHGDPALVTSVMAEGGLGGGWVRLDSQVKYAAVACGMAEVYLRPLSAGGYREKSWDHAAGAVIVEEAGGRVTDLDGLPLDFAAGARLQENRGVVASNGSVHDHVLGAVAAAEGH